MKQSTQPINAFLVHAHSDNAVVHKLYTRLIKDGVKAWLDAENLQPGQDSQHEIRKALLTSDVVIVCLSRVFDQQQGYRHEELKIALEKAKLPTDNEIFISRCGSKNVTCPSPCATSTAWICSKRADIKNWSMQCAGMLN